MMIIVYVGDESGMLAEGLATFAKKRMISAQG
jgi:hypothetical protein